MLPTIIRNCLGRLADPLLEEVREILISQLFPYEFLFQGLKSAVEILRKFLDSFKALVWNDNVRQFDQE